MPRSATPATRNEATRRLKPPKRTTSAKLPIGTAIRGSRGRLRTVADGCDHKRDVERTHPQPPDPQSETGTLATHSGKSGDLLLFLAVLTTLAVFFIDAWIFPGSRSARGFPVADKASLSRGRRLGALLASLVCGGGSRSLHDGNLDKLRIAVFLSIYLFLFVEFYSVFIIFS